MNKVKLKDVVQYSKNRISYDKLDIKTYISTDNLLQNKLGVTQISNLPSSIINTPKYEEGNILVSNIRPYLKKILYAKNEGGVSSDVLIFVANKRFDSKFVYYNLFQDSFFEHMMVGSKGTKMPRGDKSQILEFEIPLFEFDNQQKIASVLSALDDKIELNNKINAELEAMAKTLYDYWFVQFDFPNAEGKPYRSSGGKMVFNETLKREIPEGWEVNKFKFLVNKVSNTINPDEYLNLKYLPIDKIPKKSFLYSEYEDRNNALSSIIKFDEDDILLGAMRVYFHRVCLALESGISRNTIFVLRAKNEIYKFYSLMLLNKDESIQFANDNSTGSSIPYAKWDNGLAELNCIIPPNNLLKDFNVLLFPILEKVKNLSKQNQELAQLRDWLLPMLMNGQISVE